QLFAPDELVAKFDLDGCQKNPATFDNQKLSWMNGEYLRKLSAETVVDRARPFLEKARLGGIHRDELARTVKLELEKVKLLSEVPAKIDFFFQDVVFDPKAVEKVLKPAGTDKILADLGADLAKLEPFT